LGGRLDATNVVRSPVVCGVASLGYDHMELLGNTLAMIAGEKAGIFKAGVPAFTAPQPKEAMDALLKRAKELSISLEIAPTLESYGVENVQLGLEGEHQQINAALAVALCISWACRSPPSDRIHQLQQEVARGGLPDSFLKGLASTKWPGRAEVVHDPSGRLSFYLDGAHSPESMEACANWFCSVVKAEKGGSLKGESNGTHCIEASSDVDDKEWNSRDLLIRRVSNPIATNKDCPSLLVLLFNCMPKRDPQSLLPPIINTCMRTGVPLHMALFVPPYSSLISLDKRVPFNGATSDLSWQQTVQRHWESLLEGKLSGRSSTAAVSHKERYAPHIELLSELKNSTDFGGQQEGCIVGSSSAVVHSLPAALEWFRNCTSRHPHLRLQVLVTGSLYLVGDVLRLLKH
jgi:folylpolyglutamate synthase